MRLTVEENPETIKRYGHLKPAPRWGSVRCGARCPGTSRTCTREESHRGPHAAHGMFKRVVAVWDTGTPPGHKVEHQPTVAARLALRDTFRTGGVVAAWRAVRSVVPDLETGIYLTFFVAFVGFVIYWFLLILGGPL
jgi:hypothetical protein